MESTKTNNWKKGDQLGIYNQKKGKLGVRSTQNEIEAVFTFDGKLWVEDMTGVKQTYAQIKDSLKAGWTIEIRQYA